MRRAGGRILLGLLLAAAAEGDEPACAVRRGLYDEWLALSGSATRVKNLNGALLRTPPAGAPDRAKLQVIGEEYQTFFRCLSDTPERLDRKTAASFCDQAAGDRLGLLVCQGVLYLKSGRTARKDFVKAFPAGRKGAEAIWDLEAIVGALPTETRSAPIFPPDGPAFKLIDELFLLVLDDTETAAAKYFNIAAYASGAGAKHMDEQIKVLLRESPGVVVKEWAVLRQYQPKLKSLLADMVASLPRAEVLKMRQGVAGFCPKANLDCREIQTIFGRPD